MEVGGYFHLDSMKVSITTSGGLLPYAPRKEVVFDIEDLPSGLRERAEDLFTREALGSIQSNQGSEYTADARTLVLKLIDDNSHIKHELDEAICPSDLLDLIDEISKSQK